MEQKAYLSVSGSIVWTLQLESCFLGFRFDGLIVTVRFSSCSGVDGSGADFSFGLGDCNDLSSSSFVADCICFGFRSTGLICLSGVVWWASI